MDDVKINGHESNGEQLDDNGQGDQFDERRVNKNQYLHQPTLIVLSNDDGIKFKAKQETNRCPVPPMSASLAERRKRRLFGDSKKELTATKPVRIRSASVGRNKDNDLKSRYWAFLFENLHRAVDEIYQNCERDESIFEAKETILVLGNYTREFEALNQWIMLNNDYESTPPPNRPTSLTWEVRKSMPGQMIFRNQFFKQLNTGIKVSNSATSTSNILIAQSNSSDELKSETSKDGNLKVNESSKSVEKVAAHKPISKLNPDAKPFVKSQKYAIPPGSVNQSDVTSKKVSECPKEEQKSHSTTAYKSTLSSEGVKSAPVTGSVYKSTSVLNDSNSSSKDNLRLEPKRFSLTITPSANKACNKVSLTKSSSQTVLATKKLSSSTKENIKSKSSTSINIISTGKEKPQSRKIKDEDGFELVRGRNRFRNTPPKKIIDISCGPCETNNVDMFSSWPGVIDKDLVRTPGRALQIHEKLSSPSRKRSASESAKRHEEKLAKAREAREKFLEEKARKLKGKANKVEELKALREEQQQQLKLFVQIKQQRADEKRKQQLERIVKKAHDEESKVNEIQFINTLEASMKRHDIKTKEQDHESRLQDLQDERQRKQEEKAAKEAAVEERRKALEAERQAWLDDMEARRKIKDRKIQKHLEEKEKERMELAVQKAKDRKERISAINAAHQANVEVLQKKIQLKLEESKRRHDENMDLIRQRAFELSVRKSTSSGNDDAPVSVPYETKKMCTLCNILIGSEVYLYSHLRGKKHQDVIKECHQGEMISGEELECYNLKYITDVPADTKDNELNPEATLDKERIKGLKKRCKKLKQKMISKGNCFENDFKENQTNGRQVTSPNKTKLLKFIKDLNVLNSDTKITGPWPSNMVHSLDRALNELDKLIIMSSQEKAVFIAADGLKCLTNLLNRLTDGTKERPTSFPNKTFVHIVSLFQSVCLNNFENCRYVFNSNIITSLLDHLAHRLNILVSDTSTNSIHGNLNSSRFDIVSGSLAKLLALTFENVLKHKRTQNFDFQSLNQRINDVISYTVSIGIVDKLYLHITTIQGPVDSEFELAQFLDNCVSLLTSLTKLLTITLRNGNVFDGNKPEDGTQLIITLKMTQISGILSLVYNILLHSGASKRGPSSPTQSPQHTIDVTLQCLKLLNHVALLDLQMLQNILGSEGLSLQLRHIASYLLWYCTHYSETELLHEVILLIGYFTVTNQDNQGLIELGQRPTVLQQLCLLPFEYFSDPQLFSILFPTLMSCCYNNNDNKCILEQEMSTSMLSDFIETTILDLQARALDNRNVNDDESNVTSILDKRWTLASRLPKNQWTQAINFFRQEDGNGI